MANYTGKKLSFTHNGDTFILDPVSVFEYPDVEHFPAIGQSGKIYIPLNKNAIYRWDNTDQEYIPISSSGDINIASEYDSSSTYLKDDVVLYDDLLYRANADISTAEEWTPAHWTATTVAAELIRRIHTMTGASSSTAGGEGYVPAPSAGDQDKVLTGDGTWKESPGAKVYVKTVTITNTSGSYSQTFVDENISASMKAVEIEVNRSYVFGDSIIVTPNDGSVTVECADVAGTDTIKISLIKTIDDPTAVTSTEFTLLNNRIGTLANLTTTDKTNIVAAVNEVNGGLEDAVEDIEENTQAIASNTQAIGNLNSDLSYARNASSTNDVLASALACTGTTVYRGSGSSYTGILPDNNFKWGAFVVVVADALRYVWAQSSANYYATNFYNGSTWSGWQVLAQNINSGYGIGVRHMNFIVAANGGTKTISGFTQNMPYIVMVSTDNPSAWKYAAVWFMGAQNRATFNLGTAAGVEVTASSATALVVKNTNSGYALIGNYIIIGYGTNNLTVS